MYVLRLVTPVNVVSGSIGVERGTLDSRVHSADLEGDLHLRTRIGKQPSLDSTTPVTVCAVPTSLALGRFRVETCPALAPHPSHGELRCTLLPPAGWICDLPTRSA